MADKLRQRKTGTVISRAGVKTVIVRVDTYVAHPLYKKQVRTTKRFAVHDQTDATPIGSAVVIGETRPLSRTKRWEIIKVIDSKRVESKS